MALNGARVFSESLRISRERFGSLLGIVAVFIVIQIVISGIMAIVMGGAMIAGMAGMSPQADLASMAGFGAGAILGIVIFYIVYILIAFAQYGSLSAMASPLQRLSFGDALSAGLRSSPTTLGVAILSMIAYVVVAFVFGLALAMLATVLGSAGSVVSLVIFVGALVYFASRLVPIMPVIAVEGVRNPVTALTRSWSLTKGHTLKIVLLNGAFIVVALLLLGLAFVPFFSSIQGAQATGTAPDIGNMFITFGLALVAGVILMIFGSAFQAVIHAELAGHAGEDLALTFE